jgi:sugar phosphate isomerase/epimerase
MTVRIGLATGACVEVPILEMLPACAASGAAGLEIGTPPRHFDAVQPDQVAALDRVLRTIPLPVISLHAPFGGMLDLADPNPHHRATAIDAIVASAAGLQQLGGSIIVVHPSDLERHRHAVCARITDSAASIALVHERCGPLRVRIAVESPLPHLIGGDPAEFSAILERLDPAVGVCLDTGHTWLGGHWRRFVQVAGPRLIHVHIHDNHGYGDDHLPPGDGVVDWTVIRESLRDVGYDGWAMLELKCPVGVMGTYFRHAVLQAQERLLA